MALSSSDSLIPEIDSLHESSEQLTQLLAAKKPNIKTNSSGYPELGQTQYSYTPTHSLMYYPPNRDQDQEDDDDQDDQEDPEDPQGQQEPQKPQGQQDRQDPPKQEDQDEEEEKQHQDQNQEEAQPKKACRGRKRRQERKSLKGRQEDEEEEEEKQHQDQDQEDEGQKLKNTKGNSVKTHVLNFPTREKYENVKAHQNDYGIERISKLYDIDNSSKCVVELKSPKYPNTLGNDIFGSQGGQFIERTGGLRYKGAEKELKRATNSEKKVVKGVTSEKKVVKEVNSEKKVVKGVPSEKKVVKGVTSEKKVVKEEKTEITKMNVELQNKDEEEEESNPKKKMPKIGSQGNY